MHMDMTQIHAMIRNLPVEAKDEILSKIAEKLARSAAMNEEIDLLKKVAKAARLDKDPEVMVRIAKLEGADHLASDLSLDLLTHPAVRETLGIMMAEDAANGGNPPVEALQLLDLLKRS